MAHAYGWKPAWTETDYGEVGTLDIYTLPNGERLYRGDQFFDTEERFLITVDEIRTKIYRGVVGPDGAEGGDFVFYDRDWSPPVDPMMETHWSNDVHFVDVDTFADRLADRRYIPHRGNGPPQLPP